MASSNLALAQAAVNRFSDKVSFGGPIPVDGGMGTSTLRAITEVISWIGDGGGLFDSISPAMRGGALGIAGIIGSGSSANATAVMQQLANITAVLTQTANELGLPAVVAPPKPSGGGAIVVNPNTGNAVLPGTGVPPATGSVLDSFGKRLGLTTTQTVLFLGILGGVGFLAVKRMRER